MRVWVRVRVRVRVRARGRVRVRVRVRVRARVRVRGAAGLTEGLGHVYPRKMGLIHPPNMYSHLFHCICNVSCLQYIRCI